MANILALAIILILLFNTDRVRAIGKIALTLIVGIGLIGLIFNNPISVEMFTSTNFLLLVVIYILVFRVDRFKEKSKTAMGIIIGGIVFLYFIAFVISATQNISKGNWSNSIVRILFLLGSLIVAYVINIIINRYKNKK